jgi:DNA-binding SARP family transcriptional activator
VLPDDDDRGTRVLELQVLGPVTLRADGVDVRLSALERGLLARAALTTLVSPGTLAPWLWDDTPPASVPNRIQALVSGIRRKCAAAGESILTTEAGGYRLVAEVDVDLVRHQERRGRARSLAAARDPRCLEAFRAALADHRPPALQGVPSTAAVEIERDRLEQERLTLWEEHAEAALDLGRGETVLTDLATLTAQNPFREVLLAQHVLALAATGQQELALRTYREAYERLDAELGVAPSARLQEAHAQVLGGEAVAPGTRPAATAAAPEPAPALAAPGLPVPRTLPRRPAGFVGRGEELGRLAQAAERAVGSAVVVQLTGLTGMGKSALAVEGGQRLRELLPDGALYLDAAREGGPVDVAAALGTFLRLLGVHPQAVPETLEERAALYRSLLDGRRVLVVLDGVDDAGDLTPLLPAGAGALAFVTARFALPWLDPDVRLQVGSLPTAEALELVSGVVGAERVTADPDGAEALVRAVGGMPLALRVVASRALVRPDLGLAEVAAKVVGGAGHQHDDGLATLEASLRHVWARLSDQTRDVAARIARLPLGTVSGWVPGVLEQDDVAGDSALEELLATSLVEPVLRPGRTAQYRLHDVVRRLVVDAQAVSATDVGTDLERLAVGLLVRAVGPHAAHPTQLLPAPAVPGVDRVVLRRRATARERRDSLELFATENVLARVLARHLAERRPDLAWRLLAITAAAHHSAPTEGDWLACVDVVLSALDGRADDDSRSGAAHLLLGQAWQQQSRSSSSAPARLLADTARRRLTLLGEHRAAAAASVLCAVSALSLGRRHEAEADVARAEEALTRVDDPVLVGWVAIVQGTIHNDYDELAEAARWFTRAREVLTDTPASAAFGQATLELSRACRRRGALGPADLLIDEALAGLDRDDESHVYSYALDARAEVSVALGRADEALQQADQAWRRAVQARDPFLTARARRARAGALRLLGRLDEAEDDLRASVEEFTVLGRSLSVAASLRELALVLDLQGRAAAANEVYRQERLARIAGQLDPVDGHAERAAPPAGGAPPGS